MHECSYYIALPLSLLPGSAWEQLASVLATENWDGLSEPWLARGNIWGSLQHAAGPMFFLVSPRLYM